MSITDREGKSVWESALKPRHVTRDWDKDNNPICVPDCPACNYAPDTPLSAEEGGER
jgi:hypothetical protein